jgi:Ran GTPase-activating protein (RanGAP) involved in mRNA processing and transport/GTPase SAR1 family protein
MNLVQPSALAALAALCLLTTALSFVTLPIGSDLPPSTAVDPVLSSTPSGPIGRTNPSAAENASPVPPPESIWARVTLHTAVLLTLTLVQTRHSPSYLRPCRTSLKETFRRVFLALHAHALADIFYFFFTDAPVPDLIGLAFGSVPMFIWGLVGLVTAVSFTFSWYIRGPGERYKNSDFLRRYAVLGFLQWAATVLFPLGAALLLGALVFGPGGSFATFGLSAAMVLFLSGEVPIFNYHFASKLVARNLSARTFGRLPFACALLPLVFFPQEVAAMDGGVGSGSSWSLAVPLLVLMMAGGGAGGPPRNFADHQLWLARERRREGVIRQIREGGANSTLNLNGREFDIEDVRVYAEEIRRNATPTTSFDLSAFNDVTIQAFAGVFRDVPLEGLTLSDSTIGPEGTRSLGQLSMLKKLLIHEGCNMGEAGALALGEALKVNTSLTELDIRKSPIGRFATLIFLGLKENKTLTSLCFEKCQIGDESAQAIADALMVNSSLNSFSVHGGTISAVGARIIAKSLEENTSLTSVGLGNYKIGNEGAEAIAHAMTVQASLALSLSLETPPFGFRLLYLSSCSIGDAGAEAIGEALKHYPSLETLRLANNNIGDAGGHSIGQALSVNDSLKWLELSGNQIGDMGSSAIGAGLSVHPSLENLDLRENRIGSAGARALAKALSINTSLRELGLAKNPIDDQGAQAIALALRANPYLKRLQLDVGDEGAQAFSVALLCNIALTSLQISYEKLGPIGRQSFWEINNTISLNSGHFRTADVATLRAQHSSAYAEHQSKAPLERLQQAAIARVVSLIRQSQGLDLDALQFARELVHDLPDHPAHPALERFLDTIIVVEKVKDTEDLAVESDMSLPRALALRLMSTSASCRRFRLVLLGDSRAGKTATLRSLAGKPFDPELLRTDGADHHYLKVGDFSASASGPWSTIDEWSSSTLQRQALARAKAAPEPPQPPPLVPATPAVTAELRAGVDPIPPGPTEHAIREEKQIPDDKAINELEESFSRFQIGDKPSPDEPTANNIHISVFDCAGQEQFRDMHRILISNRSVYLIVVSTLELLKDPPAEQTKVKGWVSSVKLGAPEAKVIVVVTRCNDLSASQRGPLMALLLPLVRGVADLVWVDNNPASAGEPAGIKELRIKIMTTATSLFEEMRPCIELYLEAQLVSLREKGILWLETGEANATSSRFGLTAEESADLLDILHHNGVVLLTRAGTKVVLDPISLVTKVIKNFLPLSAELEGQRFASLNDSLAMEAMDQWLSFCDLEKGGECGVLRINSPLLAMVIGLALRKDGVVPEVTDPNRGWIPEHVLEVMADYHLCARILDPKGDYYLFPSILMAMAEMTASDRIADIDPALTLHRTFDMDVRVGGVSVPLPVTLFRVLVCRMLARWGQTDGRTIACLKDGAHFIFQDAEIVLEWDPSYTFSAEIYAVNFGDVVRYRKELEVELGAVLTDHLKGASFALGLRGFCCDGKDRSHFRSWVELGAFRLQTRKILCPRGRPKNIVELFDGDDVPSARVSLTEWLVDAPKLWVTATCRADLVPHLETIRFFFDRAITAVKMATDGTSANELSEGLFVVHSVTGAEPVLVLVASSGARKDANAVAFVKQLVVRVCLGEQQALDPAQELENNGWLEAADLIRTPFTSIDELRRHPFFWDDAKQISFFVDLGAHLGNMAHSRDQRLTTFDAAAMASSRTGDTHWSGCPEVMLRHMGTQRPKDLDFFVRHSGSSCKHNEHAAAFNKAYAGAVRGNGQQPVASLALKTCTPTSPLSPTDKCACGFACNKCHTLASFHAFLYQFYNALKHSREWEHPKVSDAAELIALFGPADQRMVGIFKYFVWPDTNAVLPPFLARGDLLILAYKANKTL